MNTTIEIKTEPLVYTVRLANGETRRIVAYSPEQAIDIAFKDLMNPERN